MPFPADQPTQPEAGLYELDQFLPRTDTCKFCLSLTMTMGLVIITWEWPENGHRPFFFLSQDRKRTPPRSKFKETDGEEKNVALIRHHEASMLILLVTHLSEKSVTAPSLLTEMCVGSMYTVLWHLDPYCKSQMTQVTEKVKGF